MATRKYKKIQSKTKKMKSSGNTTSSSKKKDSNKNKKNSKDDLDILESGNKSENLLDYCKPIYSKTTQVFQNLLYITSIYINLLTLKNYSTH